MSVKTNNSDINVDIGCCCHEASHDGCGKSDHDHDHKDEKNKYFPLIRAAAGLAAMVVLFIFEPPFYAALVLYIAVYFMVGYKVLWSAARNISKGRVFDENLLMSVASIGAFFIGEYPEGVAVMIFYIVGEWFQDMAVNRSKRSIQALLNIRPDTANIVRADGSVSKIAAVDVAVGDIIEVRPGEYVPLDGVVIQGDSSLDTSALSGESLPVDIAPESEALSGSINLNGVIRIRVTSSFGESTVSKILKMVQDATAKKSPAEKFISRFARIYTPVVVSLAAAITLLPPLALWLINGGLPFALWAERGLTFLVISCPCALVISVPLGYFGGLGAASRAGVLLKGSNYLDNLKRVDTVVFDKTGTLTEGSFKIVEVSPAEGTSRDELLRIVAHAESFSSHPVARSVVSGYGRELSLSVSGQHELSGRGVSAVVDGVQILAGNGRLMAENSIDVPQDAPPAGTVVYAAADGRYIGFIIVGDTVKVHAAAAIEQLYALGVRRTVMLSGDRPETAAHMGRGLGLSEIHGGLLPNGKVEHIERLMAEKGTGSLLFVGDGINDAPALARADVGVCMGGMGSDAANQAADMIILNDDLRKIAAGMQIARRTGRIVSQNIVFALGFKFVVMALSFLSIPNILWLAVFADVGVSLLAILNSLRALRSAR